MHFLTSRLCSSSLGHGHFNMFVQLRCSSQITPKYLTSVTRFVAEPLIVTENRFFLPCFCEEPNIIADLEVCGSSVTYEPSKWPYLEAFPVFNVLETCREYFSTIDPGIVEFIKKFIERFLEKCEIFRHGPNYVQKLYQKQLNAS